MTKAAQGHGRASSSWSSPPSFTSSPSLITMASTSQIGPVPQQYAAAATVPLIKSPSLWLPPPIEFPNDIHPLPDDITAYFVYPFTLEQHVLGLQPPPQVAIAEKRARLAAVLHAREVEEEQKEKAALHRLAPGYNPQSVLVPTSASGPAPPTESPSKSIPADPMDALVAQLEQMEQGK